MHSPFLRLPSPVLVVFNATEQEGILSAVEESGIEVLGQTNAETSNIIEVIELLKAEQSREGEEDQQDSDATIRLEFLETDENTYQGRTGSSKENMQSDSVYRRVYICVFKLRYVISPSCGAHVLRFHRVRKRHTVNIFQRASRAPFNAIRPPKCHVLCQ